MKKLLAIAVLATALSSNSAFALFDTTDTNNSHDNPVANGGAGGAGGSAAGGSVTRSGNSQITNSGNSRNTNRNASSSNNSGGNSSNSYTSEAQKRNPVSTAWAAPLAAGAETCMGSSSAGGQGVGLGLSFGTTWHDENCERRHDAIMLHNLGQKKAAVALMCQDQKVARAMAAAGTPCVGADSDNDEFISEASRRSASVEPTYEWPSQKPIRH
ncbi:MAG TPA: hypothetical protein VFE62_24200 [Gemmataceae bacterium]|nr:hypothetical protein [Gemmataceae bacterium]